MEARKVAFAAALAGIAAAYGFQRWRPFRIEVAGASMRPTLEPGDWALAVRARRVRRGDVVVVEHPERAGFELVKRVTHVPGDLAPRARAGRPGLDRGDHPDGSSDSRRFGPVPMGLVRGRVWLVWWPPGRIRALGSLRMSLGGCGISHLTGSICSCNDPDTLPWSRGGHDPRPMLLSPGAPRSPLGVAPGTEPAPPPRLHDRSQRRTLRWTSSPPPWTLGASPALGPLVALHKALGRRSGRPARAPRDRPRVQVGRSVLVQALGPRAPGRERDLGRLPLRDPEGVIGMVQTARDATNDGAAARRHGGDPRADRPGARRTRRR